MKRLHCVGDLLRGETGLDVLGTVHIPPVKVEDEGAIYGGPVCRVGELLHELGIILDDLSRSPDLDATAIREVHEENERFVIVLKVSDRDVLAVSTEVGKSERLRVQDFEKPGWTSAVLNIGLSVGIHCPQEQRIALRNKLREFRRHLVLPASSLLHGFVDLARAQSFLNRLDRWREGNIADRRLGHEAFSR